MRAVLLTALLVGCLSAGMAADSVGDDLEAILARPEYNRWSGGDADSGRLDSWMQLVRGWFEREERPPPKPRPRRSEVVRERRAGGGGGDASGLFTVVGYGLLIATGVFLVYAIVEGLREGGGEKKAVARRSGVGMARALVEGDALAFADTVWREEAERLLGRGEIRMAYRSLYLGLLSGLHERGSIVFATNRTNWHYVRMYRGEAGSRDEFSAMTALFDEVWYGLHDALSQQGLKDMEARVARLLAPKPASPYAPAARI